tara:strand:- start:452 stop:643 length:192 start_codon:yes stop_codon:yes gene_type:complete
MNHFMNNGKEYLKKENKVRQYRSNQGKSPHQMKNSYKAIEWSFVGLLVVGIIYLVCGVFGLEL